jgi:TPR repeat protein
MAQFAFGGTYLRGIGGTKDYPEGAKWIRKAAEGGYPKAQAVIGMAYGIGMGVSRDLGEALMWLNIAAANGYKDERTERMMKRVSASDLQKSQQRAKRCMASSYKDCD